MKPEIKVPEGWELFHSQKLTEDIPGCYFNFSVLNDRESEFVILRKLPDPNPMPELEPGDWYSLGFEGVHEWENTILDYKLRDQRKITEIRKPNGQVWKREG